jgi:signal transduction histidine kinase
MTETVRRWAARDRVIDLALVLAVLVATSVPFVDPPPGSVTALGVVLNAGTVVPLLWRRRAPFAVMVVVATAATLVSLHHRPGQNLQYGGLVAIYTVAALGRRRWQRLGVLVAILVTFPPASLLLKRNDLEEFMFTFLLPVAAFLLGSLERSHREHAEALRERARQLERERIAEAARAAAEERARVARDMHDILAHAVSLMVVQAEAGPVALRADPHLAERAFVAIADAGRDAMTQLRRLLGVLRPGEVPRAPQPTLDDLADLVGGIASLEVRGDPRPITPDAEVAVYRIVQEALTNTVKHAQARHVAVRLDWLPAELEVSVTDDGRGRVAAGAGGHGLIGIRERATACGGSATAGPGPDGGFVVRARLPYEKGTP